MQAVDARASLRFLLRDRTRASHDRLEATPLMGVIAGGQATVDDLRAYLFLQLALHAPMEAALSPWVPPGWADTRLQKSHWLRHDLRALGPAPPDRPVEIPAVASRAAALGMAYVLEGGTLGLQVVRRRLPDGHVALGAAGRFFRGYGPETGSRWQAFVAALDALPPATWPEAAETAEATFAAFHRVFSIPGAVAA